MRFLSRSPNECNFCLKCKLVAISLQLRGVMFASISHKSQIASSFEHVRNKCDIAATNRTEIAASLHADVKVTQLERDKNCIEECDKSCIKNRMYKRAFIERGATIANKSNESQIELKARLHVRFLVQFLSRSPIFIANSSATKIALKSATKIAQKNPCVNGPLRIRALPD